MRFLQLTFIFVLYSCFLFSQVPVVSSIAPIEGTTGISVTITGQNFTGVTSVQFAGVEALGFVVINDQTIQAGAPESSTGPITLFKSAGEMGMSPVFFSYITGTPVITDFYPRSAGIGSYVTITGSNFVVPPGQVYIGGALVNSFGNISSTAIVARVPATATAGDVVVTSPEYGNDTMAGFTVAATPVITSFFPTDGSPGTVINITGQNFTGATFVGFGTLPAAGFTVVNDNTITAVVGSNGASGDVAVITPVGNTIKSGFTFFSFPPSISGFSPAVAYTNDVVTIRGNFFATATGVQFGAMAAQSFTISGDTIIRAVVGNGASGSISVTSPYGTDYREGFTFTNEATVPPVIAGFSPATSIAGGTVILKGQYFTFATGVYFGGTPAQSYTVFNDSTIAAVVGSGSTGDVIVSNAAGADTLPGFTHTLVGIISVTPQAAPVGGAVTIKGNYFSSNATANTVYFGAAVATIISATDSTLQVLVPSGATQSRVSVTANGMYAASIQNFTVTFSSDGSAFDATSFGLPAVYPAIYPRGLAIKDLDKNGKPDFMYGEWMGTTSSKVVVNKSTPGNILFDTSRVNLYVLSYSGSVNLLADLDGDGMEDFIAPLEVFNDTVKKISVRRNTSTAGAISFSAEQYLTARSVLNGVKAIDADKDGKLDLVLLNTSASTSPKYIVVYRNTSTPGNISFAPGVEFVTYANAVTLATGDFNNDGKDDIITGSTDTVITLHANNSTPGNVSFTSYTTMAASAARQRLVVTDIDGDGKADILAQPSQVLKVDIFRNITTGNTYAFEQRQSITTQNVPGDFEVADLDGDALPELVVGNSFGNPAFISVYKNTSTSGNLSFATPANYRTSLQAMDIAVGDIDIDGKQDILVATQDQGSNYGQLCLLRNKIGELNTVELCPPAASTSFTASTGSLYQWQINTGTGFTSLTDNSYYTGSNQPTLNLNNVPSSFNGYQYRCNVDGNSGKTYQLKFTNAWAGNGNGGQVMGVFSQWNNDFNWSCGTVPDADTDVVISYGIVTVNANATCRTLTVMPGASLVVATGVTLTVTH